MSYSPIFHALYMICSGSQKEGALNIHANEFANHSRSSMLFERSGNSENTKRPTFLQIFPDARENMVCSADVSHRLKSDTVKVP